MPPKKKSSSKKGKNKRNKEETFNTKKAWAVDGRKDATGLARALPETARGLKSGDVLVDEAAAQFAGLALDDCMTEFRSLPEKKNPNKSTDWVAFICAYLPHMALAPANSSDEMTVEFYAQLVDTFNRNHDDTADARGMTEFYSILLQGAFDQVAGEWEPRIQRMTGRPFTETCHVYKVSRDVFFAFVRNILEDFFDTSSLRDADDREALEQYNAKHREMRHVMVNLARGDDEVLRTCWCCGKHDRAITHCSKCHAARYCSRDCQVKSWKEGHKHVCSDLKTAYEGFTNDLKRVDKAVEEGVAGIQHTPRLDYVLVRLLREEMLFLSDVSGTLLLVHPSMDVFYRNLTYIIQGGDHWLFEDTPNPSFAEGSFMKGSVRPLTRPEAINYTTLMTMMACDTSGLPKDKLSTFKEKCLGYKQTFDLDGCTWTAERLLQVYSTFDSAFEAPCGAKESRTECVVNVVGLLRKNYTKSDE